MTLVSLASCKKDKDFPTTPVLKNREFKKLSTSTALWRMGFTDGDGDIGVENASDTANFIVTIYSIKNGVDSAMDAQNYRIPVVENIRTVKGIEGEIRFDIDGLDFFKPAKIDSVYYEGYLLDRAGNKSNVLATPKFDV